MQRKIGFNIIEIEGANDGVSYEIWCDGAPYVVFSVPGDTITFQPAASHDNTAQNMLILTRAWEAFQARSDWSDFEFILEVP